MKISTKVNGIVFVESMSYNYLIHRLLLHVVLYFIKIPTFSILAADSDSHSDSKSQNAS